MLSEVGLRVGVLRRCGMVRATTEELSAILGRLLQPIEY